MNEERGMLTETPAQGRLDFLDLMKCIAMLCVVVYHSRLYPFVFWTDPRAIVYLNYGFSALLSVCVPLFFFVNGYLLLTKPFDLKKHIIKTVRLAVLTVVWMAIHLAVAVLAGQMTLSLSGFVMALWEHDALWTSHFWFMGALVCVYVFFPLMKAAYDRSRKAFLWFTGVCALMTIGSRLINMLLTLGLRVFTGEGLYLEASVFNMFNAFGETTGYAFAYFCIGGLMAALRPRLEARLSPKHNLLAVLGVAVSTALLALWGVFVSRIIYGTWDVVLAGYDTVFTLINVLLIFFLCLNYRPKDGLVPRFIRSVSANTLGVYCLHIIPIRLTIELVMRVPALCNVGVNLVYALFIVCLCWGVTLLLKKIPILRRLF